jgi:hypothetical protein
VVASPGPWPLKPEIPAEGDIPGETTVAIAIITEPLPSSKKRRARLTNERRTNIGFFLININTFFIK